MKREIINNLKSLGFIHELHKQCRNKNTWEYIFFNAKTNTTLTLQSYFITLKTESHQTHSCKLNINNSEYIKELIKTFTEQ